MDKCEQCLSTVENLGTTRYVWEGVQLGVGPRTLHAVVRTPQTHLLCMMTQEGSNA